MIAYALGRLGAALAVIALAVTLAFLVLRGLPGDAVDAALGQAGASDQEIAARRAVLGLDDPLWRQYFDYWTGFARGDWGKSLVSEQPVTRVIGQNLGPTVALASSALGFAMTLGVLLGVLAGTAPQRGVRLAAEGVASLMLSTPIYWTATLAIYLFTVAWDLLPGVGGDDVRHLILPAGVLGFHTAGSIAQVTASNLREAARQDFVRTARAKGLTELDVLDHVLRVGLLPVIAVIALQLGFLLGGTVITETIFVRRGIGRVLLTAIEDRDYPVIQGIVALSAMTYSLVGALADVLYRWVDPRVRHAVIGD